MYKLKCPALTRILIVIGQVIHELLIGHSDRSSYSWVIDRTYKQTEITTLYIMVHVEVSSWLFFRVFLGISLCPLFPIFRIRWHSGLRSIWIRTAPPPRCATDLTYPISLVCCDGDICLNSFIYLTSVCIAGIYLITLYMIYSV